MNVTTYYSVFTYTTTYLAAPPFPQFAMAPSEVGLIIFYYMRRQTQIDSGDGGEGDAGAIFHGCFTPPTAAKQVVKCGRERRIFRGAGMRLSMKARRFSAANGKVLVSTYCTMN